VCIRHAISMHTLAALMTIAESVLTSCPPHTHAELSPQVQRAPMQAPAPWAANQMGQQQWGRAREEQGAQRTWPLPTRALMWVLVVFLQVILHG
jgi:hypothetical protein